MLLPLHNNNTLRFRGAATRRDFPRPDDARQHKASTDLLRAHFCLIFPARSRRHAAH